MSTSADEETRHGEERLSYTMERLIGLLRPDLRDHETTRAAIDVKNTRAVADAVNRLAGVIERASDVATRLSRIGIGLTIVLALAAVVQVVVLIVSLCR